MFDCILHDKIDDGKKIVFNKLKTLFTIRQFYLEYCKQTVVD